MSIDVERLKVDESLWPDWAGVALKHYSGGRLCFASKFEQSARAALVSCPEEVFNLSKSCWKDPIPRPKAPEAEWVDGLPPVGSVVEVKTAGIGGSIWQEVKIVHYAHNKVWLHKMSGDICVDDWITGIKSVEFRPFLTRLERERRDLHRVIDNAYQREPITPDHVVKIADAILSRYNLEPKQ